MLFASLIPAWLQMRSNRFACGYLIRGLPMPAFAACFPTLLRWWVTPSRPAYGAVSRPWSVPGFGIVRSSGTAFLMFPRRASWCSRTWMIPPGRGAFVGDMHAAILKALGCVGYLTNGAVRELPSVRTMGVQLFAGSVAVSHAY